MLSTWPILRMAIDQGWANSNESSQNISSRTGQQQLIDFVEDLYKFAYEFKVEDLDVQDFLLDYMEKKFFTSFEDQSEKIIANYLIKLIDDLEKGNTKVLQEIKENCEKIKGAKIDAKGLDGNKNLQALNEDEDEENDDDGEEYEDDGEEYEDIEDEEDEEESKETEEERKKREQLESDGFTVVGGGNKKKSKAKKQETEEEKQKREFLESDGFTVVGKK
ncbi:hypothetical protein PPERSA_11358 [Pseudocohnilembus persalinus]|uniref:Pre-rRNA-processing protein TSR2 n=1 Tax=Pseudocohnilembus persalinus TaxID=266149 RepID=A0A0V0QQC5_PSEPJ|nr:hypothetical protein PPERSA_11358 [Pseudocohnilembus persalinus]|eukprot:KRX04234.1 hypothetical protein PPERSA_11358 [Pseudocohnilembus persalinus]